MSVKKLLRPLFVLVVLAFAISASAYENTSQWKTRKWTGTPEFKRLQTGTLVITIPDTKSSGAWCSPVINVNPNTRYYFSAEIAAEITGGRTDFCIDFLDAKNKRIKNTEISKIRKSTPFIQKDGSMKTPKGCVKLQLLATARNTAGTVQFRNFKIVKAELPKINFSRNGLVWHPAQWGLNNIYRTEKDEFILERPNDEKGIGYWETDPVSVKPGDYFFFEAEASGSDMTGYIRMTATFYDNNGKKILNHSFFMLSTTKKFYYEKFRFVTPDGAASIRLQAYNRNGKGTARFRNVRLTKLNTKTIFAENYFIRDDLSTRISWRSSGPELERAKVIFKTPGMKDIIITEKYSGAANHSVVLPAGLIPDGKEVTAVISYGSIRKSVKFISGAVKRIAKSKPFAIKLSVSEPTASARKVWPVAGGVPFSQGVLRDISDVMLTDAAGKKVPAEFNVISRWKDGSIQFLGYTFETATDKTKPVAYTLTNSDEKTDAAIDIKSKVLDAITGKIVTADGKIMLCHPRDGKKIVSRSAACTTTEITGKFSGDAGFGYRLFVRDYPSGISTVQYSIYGGKEDTLIRNIQWELPALNDPEFSDLSKPGKVFSTLQRDEKNGTGDGFVRDRNANIAIGMRHYREKWPKGIANNDSSLALQLLPPLPADYVDSKTLAPLDIVIKYYWLKDGNYVYRRHLELTGSFTVAPADAKPEWFKEKLIAAAAPEYYCATGVFENIAPRKTGEFDRYEKIIDDGFAQATKDREDLAQYGWMNYGDWFGERYYNWGNNEYDLAFTMALFFARTADSRYFRRGMEMADHYQSVDRYTPRDDMEKKTKYEHCSGHTGNFFKKNDPRFNNFNLQAIIIKEAFDTAGGHNFEKGSLLMAGLAGDKYLFDKTMSSIETMARTFTSVVEIPIERCPGWLLYNLVGAFYFTSDPYYSNAAEIVIDAVADKQLPAGNLNVRQNLSECRCPDKISHRGGKAFAVGVLMHSLANYYDITGHKKSQECIFGLYRWLMEQSFDPLTSKFRYKTECDNYRRGGNIYPLLLDTIYRVAAWNGDTRGKEIVIQHLGRLFPYVPTRGGSQGVMKSYSMNYRHIPHIFKLLKDDGITDLKLNLPEILRNRKKVEIPADAIKVEAESFTSQNNGSLIVRDNKIGADVCLVAWSLKHSITWKVKNPAGKYKVAMRYCSLGDSRINIRSGKTKFGTAHIPTTLGRGESPMDWHTVMFADKDGKDIILELPENASITMRTSSDPGPNPDYFYLIPVR